MIGVYITLLFLHRSCVPSLRQLEITRGNDPIPMMMKRKNMKVKRAAITGNKVAVPVRPMVRPEYVGGYSL